MQGRLHPALDPRRALGARPRQDRHLAVPGDAEQVYDRLRRRPTARLEEASEVVDPAPGPEARLQNAAIAVQIEAALAALPERQRAAIQLCHFPGLRQY